jgi:uncharacterized protein YbbC (DUF1343 family)
MKRYIYTLIATLLALTTSAQVLPGIEVLRNNNFDLLKGKRVGLITNPTGVDNQLKSTIDILHEAADVQLVALFAPEHGVRGDVHAGDLVGNAVDKATGVTVYSIYGKTRKPTAAMLKDVDVLVYDIQDTGCRSYTFISTMGLAMDACAALGKKFMVLDRPNPVSGNKVEGCVVEDSCFSFVSQFAIPYLYGLTPGELAIYLNKHRMLASGKQVDLEVVPMQGWHRDMKFADTGMPWVLPSPHIPNAEAAVYYPLSGILGELEYMSIGVGYTEPFKLFCAQWIDAEKLSQRMNALNLPGMKFRPIHIKPFYGFGKGENLQGVEVYVTDVEAAPLTLTQFYVMQVLAEMYPAKAAFKDGNANAKRFSMFDKVVGSKEIRRRFARNHRVADIIDYWQKDVEKFKAASADCYLYK